MSVNGAWRVLYRVTYVERVPPSFETSKIVNVAPDITPPANLANNTVITRLVEEYIRKNNNTADPSPVQIGTAINNILENLNNVFPWWNNFSVLANQFNSTEGKELYEIRKDLLEYMIQKYDTQLLSQ